MSEYRSFVALALAGLAIPGVALACEPPEGFVDPPRPEIAPLETLLSRTETKVIEQSLADAMKAANRPLRIDATEDLPGVTGTHRLSAGPYGTVGARRLVCTTDGHYVVEEVLLTESNEQRSQFRYLVWNYTGPKFRDVIYAVGEFTRTQPAPDRTLVSWTYRFALKDETSAEDRARFQADFVDRQFARWMRAQLDRKPDADASPPSH